VDNLIRDSAAYTTEADLGLLPSVRQFIEQNFDQNLRRPVVAAISGLQQIGNAVLRNVSATSPTLPRIPEGQASPFYNPQLPGLIFGEFQFPDDPFVAAPLSAPHTRFGPLQSSASFRSPPILGPTYQQQLGFPFPPTESSLSMGTIQPHGPSSPLLQQSIQSLHSPPFQQPAPSHRRTHSSSAILQSPTQVMSQMQQETMSFPRGPSEDWSQPQRGPSSLVRRGDRRGGHSRSRSRPR